MQSLEHITKCSPSQSSFSRQNCEKLDEITINLCRFFRSPIVVDLSFLVCVPGSCNCPVGMNTNITQNCSKLITNYSYVCSPFDQNANIRMLSHMFTRLCIFAALNELPRATEHFDLSSGSKTQERTANLDRPSYTQLNKYWLDRTSEKSV